MIASSSKPSSRAVKWVTAALLLLIGFGLSYCNQKRLGVVRDEVVYMNAGARYAQWWTGLVAGRDKTISEAQITAHFGGKRVTDNNSEHPPLMKTLFGLSNKLLGGWLGATSANRLPNAVFFGLLLAMVFLFTRSVWGYAPAVVAALLTMLMPRALFHSGIATFDAPMVTVWFAALYAYYRSLSSPWKWGLLFGLFFGLTLATKHNAIILPAAIVVHWSWVLLRSVRKQGRIAHARPVWRRALAALRSRGPLTVPAMVVIGPAVLIALWPWLWFDTVAHVARWFGFHFDHVHYNFEYLGRNWNHPPFPWHVAIVTTLFVVPVVTLLAAVFGAGTLLVCWRRGESAQPERGPALLLFLSAGVSMGPFLLRTTPIFGAEKHWAPAMPTVCIFAGIGLVYAARRAAVALAEVGWLKSPPGERALAVATIALGALAVSAAGAETAVAQPYALSHYNALAGGAPGGADLGMNRQFWGYSARGVLPFLRRWAVEHGGGKPVRVYTHDASMAWAIYRRDGLIDGMLPDSGHEAVGIARSDLAIVVHELHFNRHDFMIWDNYGTVQPVFVLTTDGVPIVSVYARPSATR